MRKIRKSIFVLFISTTMFFQTAYASIGLLAGTGALLSVGGIGAAVALAFNNNDDGDRISKYYIGDPWPDEYDQVGWVFYCEGEEPCEHGLIAADEDQAIDNIIWGCTTAKIGTKTAVGTGKNNTRKIVNYFKNCVTPIAATAAANYRGGRFEDWFLPSFDELSFMYNNLIRKGIGDFVGDYYWSSSEIEHPTIDYAIMYNLISGVPDAGQKTTFTASVRAARAF